MTLSTENLALCRGRNVVVQDVTAVLRPGEIRAICGPNGAGKSSLLLALAGLLATAVGRVQLGDTALSDLSARERARRLGYLPQSADVAWDVSVESLVALGRLPHRDRGEAPIEAAIDALALQDLRHRPISRLSGGERARLARPGAGGDAALDPRG